MIKLKMVVYLAVFLTLVGLSSYGQGKFRKGYVLTLQQDTLYGFIDYKASIRNAVKCKFRVDPKSETTTYMPDQISGYRFTSGKYYVSKSIEVGGERKGLFLEYLIDGIADIYFFRNETGDHYYIEKEGEEMLPLTVNTVEVEKDGKKYIKHKDAYKQVLKYTFSDASGLSQAIDNTDLEHSDLISIAEIYHNEVCDDYECITYSKKQFALETSIGLLIGNNFSQISFDKSYRISPELFASFPTSTNISFGAFVQVKDPFISERLSLQMEAWYSGAEYSTDELSLSYSYVKFPLLIRYTSIHRRLRPTFAFGPTGTLLFDVEALRFVNNTDWMEKGRFQIGMEGALGIVYPLSRKNNLFLEGRYNMSYGSHQNLATSGSSNQQDNFLSQATTFNIVAGISF